MLSSNFGLLIELYFRPRRALARLVDEGSLGFGAVSVMVVSLLVSLSAITAPPLAAPIPSASPAATQDPETFDQRQPGVPAAAPDFTGLLLTQAFSLGTLFTIAGLAVLFVPAALLVVTLVAPAGSFGVVFRRDYGSLAACVFFAWSAVNLPLALLRLAVTASGFGVAQRLWLGLGLSALGAIAFGGLTLLALRIIFPVSVGGALAAVVLAHLALLFQGFVSLLTSPFALYIAYLYLGGHLRDIQWSLSARRSLKRQLEAATINPKDADAHYQLGLIYLSRRQYAEARARFDQAVAIHPDDAEPRYQLGRLARRERRFGEAIEHFQAVIAKDQKHAQHEVWREIGGTYLDADDYAQARLALQRFVSNRPYDPEGLCLLGQSLIALREVEKAREILSQGIEAARTMPDYRQHEVRGWRRKAEKLLASLP